MVVGQLISAYTRSRYLNFYTGKERFISGTSVVSVLFLTRSNALDCLKRCLCRHRAGLTGPDGPGGLAARLGGLTHHREKGIFRSMAITKDPVFSQPVCVTFK